MWLHPVCTRYTNLLSLKSQKECDTCSSEAEWVVFSKAVKEEMFVIQLLGSMKISVKLPVMVSVHNVGDIFMASNITTTSQTSTGMSSKSI